MNRFLKFNVLFVNSLLIFGLYLHPLTSYEDIYINDDVKNISSYGLNKPWNETIDINVNETIGYNNLSFGVLIGPSKSWLTSETLKEKAISANIKIIRFSDFKINPCLYWNESSKSGNFDWEKMDALIQSVYDIGAEPWITIGAKDKMPTGMVIDSVTGLPNPESFSAYCVELVNHSIDKRWNIQYWEIWNEPEHYLFSNDEGGNPIWGVFNETRLNYFTKLFNFTSKSMHNIDPNILIGTDASLYQGFFDYFVHHAEGVDFLSFHKYDAWGTWLYKPEGYLSDERVLKKAARIDIGGGEWIYTPEEARNLWRQYRGVEVPVICSETNLNSCFINGTDPRIQQIIGGVWCAEEIRTFVLSDIRYRIYYTFLSDDSYDWNITSFTHGAGFGMVNMTEPHQEWYPYLVNSLLGQNLEVNDIIYDSTSSNQSSLSVLSWKNNGKIKILLNHKLKENTTVVKINLNLCLDNEIEAKMYKINDLKTIIQEDNIMLSNNSTIELKGYSIVLLSLPFTECDAEFMYNIFNNIKSVFGCARDFIQSVLLRFFPSYFILYLRAHS